jgi:hypothetical protein
VLRSISACGALARPTGRQSALANDARYGRLASACTISQRIQKSASSSIPVAPSGLTPRCAERCLFISAFSRFFRNAASQRTDS